MTVQEFYAIKYTPEAGPKYMDKISRGEALGWYPNVRMGLRELGASAVEEMLQVFPDPDDSQLIAGALKLATQEPPLTMEESWTFYDGVRDAIRLNHAEQETRA